MLRARAAPVELFPFAWNPVFPESTFLTLSFGAELRGIFAVFGFVDTTFFSICFINTSILYSIIPHLSIGIIDNNVLYWYICLRKSEIV